jgi:hypothetical protein
MMYYAIARTFTFCSDLPSAKSPWLDHLVGLNLPGGFNARIASLITALPPDHTNELDRLEKQFELLLSDLSEDPREENNSARKVTSYLAWVRGQGKMHKRPYFYTLNLSHSEYRTCLMTRMMMIKVPMFSHADFNNRTCPLCTSPHGDIEHILMECPFFHVLRQTTFQSLQVQDPHVAWLFTNNSPIAHKYIASVMSQFRSATGG